jgi:hypothetical protein
MAVKRAERAAVLHPLSFRVTPELKAKLDESASANGRSVTAEIQSRLEKSYEWERALGEFEEFKENAKIMTEEVAFHILRKAGWPKRDGTQWGTVLAMPGSIAILNDGRLGRVRKETFPPGEFIADPADDLNEPPAPPTEQGALKAETTSATLDLEDIIYRAMVRALRDVRDPELKPEDSHRRHMDK